MSSVLADIIAQKRIDVAARQLRTPLIQLQARAIPTTRKLGAALKQPGLRFIFECKKASPSEGLLRADFDPAAIAAVYGDFADGISVLTDTPYFQGEFAHLEAVRAKVDQAILCKDFVIDPYQIVEARVFGADAVLLMLSVLDDEQYRRCAAAAAALKMDVLTEVHDDAELERALALNAAIIGINNRDLKTLKIDLATTARLAPRIPNDKVIVCESGIKTRADIDAVAQWVDAYLVGSSLMKSPRLDLAARALIYGRVKICGLTRAVDIQAAYQAGASLGGLIFAKESPRYVSDTQAETLAEHSPLPLVGVFVNESLERIVALAQRLNLYAVQLHGEESPEFVRALRVLLPPGCAVWKALRVKQAIASVESTGADCLLLDTESGTARGGSGQCFDWTLLAQHPDKARMVLAGGLTPENIVQAQAYGCAVLDVNSGVESAPGIKDEIKLRQLFAALRGQA